MDKKQVTKIATIIIVLVILSGLIMGITFALASAHLNVELYKSYLLSFRLMLMNFIPIILLMTLVYLLSNKLWLGYSVAALTFVIMGIANKLKLTYRDDPLVFMDLKLVGESLEMSKTYDLSLSVPIMSVIAGLIVIGVLLKIYVKPKIESNKLRLSLLAGLLVISLVIFKGFYFNPNVYAEIGDMDKINRWIDSQQHQAKGLVYPFLYSANDVRVTPPEGYDPKEAEATLGEYTYKDIPEDKKINVISIMLEAYNDFSEFEGVDLNVDIYEEFHKLQEESIHGKLVTNVFGGGTIDTERGFLTGYHKHPKYFNNTNSFPWYFKEQGYRTEFMHPITGSFYNRRNINEYLGFDNFDHYDNKYQEIQEDYLMDMKFFDYIIEGFENSKEMDKPYFHFSITYQNHGPYSDEKQTDVEYLLKKDHYNDSDYNIVNNYLKGINETDQALKKLFDRFRDEEEPTAIVIYGDHNPWLGTNNSAYHMLDIDIDLEGVEGFKNYYQTPYLIWGNEAAEEALGKELVGDGPTISPNILMSDLFDYLDWEGNEYIQYIGDMKDKFTVNHNLFFKEDGKFTKELSEENKKAWQEFIKLEHYQSYNFHK